MKLLIIIDDLVNGGTENVLASRLKNLSKEHEVHIITLYGLGPISKVLEEAGFSVNFIDMAKIGYRRGINTVRDLVTKHKFDLALCMRDVARGLFPWFLRNLLPVVMFWDNPRIKRSFRQSWAECFQVKFANPFMYCCSNATARALRKTYGAKDIKVIPNCFDDEKFTPINELEFSTPLRIVSVGNIREEKKHADKIHIASKLKDKGFDFKLEIIGQGDCSELETLISENSLQEQVVLPGGKNDINQELRNSQIFLFTSLTEGVPVALLEAMACGLPCVTYQFPGLEEIDEDFSYLAVVNQGDTEKAAERIIYFSEHPEEAEQLGKSAAKYVVDKFSAEINAKKWEDYLISLIQKRTNKKV